MIKASAFFSAKKKFTRFRLTATEVLKIPLSSLIHHVERFMTFRIMELGHCGNSVTLKIGLAF